MKFVVLLVIVSSFLVLSVIHQVEAIPSVSTQDLYDGSDIILLGKIISQNSTFSPTYFSYEIKVEKYLKNPQPDGVITAAGLNSVNAHLGNTVFKVGDRGLFFLNNYTQKYDNNSPLMISVRSMKTLPEWDLCNLFDNNIPRDHWVFGSGDVHPKLSQGNETNTDNFSTDKEILFSYDFLNHTPEAKYFEIGVSVIDMDNSTRPSVFRESRAFSLDPCTVYKTITWSFVPTKAGHYSFDLYDPLGTRFGVGFVVHEESIPSTQNFIGNDLISTTQLSPLKQFKSGIAAVDIHCKENLQLVFKVRDGSPACVKPSSILRLVTQGWTIPSNLGSQVIAQLATDVAMQDESVQHLISGKDTYVRAVQQGVSFKDDCPFFSCSAVLIDKVDANETLVVIVSTATQKVLDIKTTPGWNQTTIQPKESTRLIPSDSLLLPQEEFAHILVNATHDKIIKKRIDDEQRVVYTTDKGNLIIVKSTQPFTGLVDYYMTGANKNLVFVKDVGFRMNKTEALDSVHSFMKNIDFKLDGTEQVDVVDFVNRIQVTIQQTNSGWIVQNQRMEFSFWQDHTTISLGKWYTNVSSIELRYSQDQAKQIAYEYLKSEMQTNSTLKELGVLSYPNSVQMEIIDDSLVYVVSGEGFNGVEVIMNPYSGAIQSWRFAMRIY